MKSRKIDLSECVYEVIPRTVLPEKESKEPLPSNRVLPEELKPYDPKNLRVTKGFQKHVAKHLDSYLENRTRYRLKIKTPKEVKVSDTKKKKNTHGVLLLSSSTVFLDSEDQIEDKNTAVRKRKLKLGNAEELDDEEMSARAKEVAVTPEFVLSKSETRHWAPETRGKVENIKL